MQYARHDILENIMIYANDKLYTLTLHAEEEMEEEGITTDMITETMEDADRSELSASTHRQIYDKQLPGRRYPLRVVVDEDRAVIVTTFFVKPPPR